MELLSFPDHEIWNKRNSFIEIEMDNAIKGGHLVSDHAAALFLELQACYCIGSWIAVVILSISIIDAHLRENEAMNPKLGTAELLKDYFEGEDIDWLRKLRNKYVHSNISKPVLEMNDQYYKRDIFEKDATRALKMTISALFQNSFI